MSVKISALTAGTALTGTEQFEAVQSGNSRRITAAQIKAYDNQETLSFRSVSNGFSETFGATDDVMILSAVGTLGNGTVTMPATPIDGQVVHLTAAMTVSTLAVNANGGQTLLGAPGTISISTPCSWVYRAANATWYRR